MAVVLTLPCAVLCATAKVAQQRQDPSKMPIRATGHIKNLLLEKRMIVIDKERYLIADDVVVKDKFGNIMTGYLLKYLNAVDFIEFIRIEQTIQEIKVLEYSS